MDLEPPRQMNPGRSIAIPLGIPTLGGPTVGSPDLPGTLAEVVK